MYSAYPLPSLSENQAISLPSGDHKGRRSAIPELRVRLRGSPFSTGTVKMSPLASNKIRLPVGDSDTLVAWLVTFSERVSAQGKSPTTLMFTWRLLPDAASSK